MEAVWKCPSGVSRIWIGKSQKADSRSSCASGDAPCRLRVASTAWPWSRSRRWRRPRRRARRRRGRCTRSPALRRAAAGRTNRSRCPRSLAAAGWEWGLLFPPREHKSARRCRPARRACLRPAAARSARLCSKRMTGRSSESSKRSSAWSSGFRSWTSRRRRDSQRKPAPRPQRRRRRRAALPALRRADEQARWLARQGCWRCQTRSWSELSWLRSGPYRSSRLPAAGSVPS